MEKGKRPSYGNNHTLTPESKQPIPPFSAAYSRFSFLFSGLPGLAGAGGLGGRGLRVFAAALFDAGEGDDDMSICTFGSTGGSFSHPDFVRLWPPAGRGFGGRASGKEMPLRIPPLWFFIIPEREKTQKTQKKQRSKETENSPTERNRNWRDQVIRGSRLGF